MPFRETKPLYKVPFRDKEEAWGTNLKEKYTKDTHDFEAADRIKRRILKLYRDDISKFLILLSQYSEVFYDYVNSQQ